MWLFGCLYIWLSPNERGVVTGAKQRVIGFLFLLFVLVVSLAWLAWAFRDTRCLGVINCFDLGGSDLSLWAVRVVGKRAWGMESCSITRCRIYAIGRGLVFSEGWAGGNFVAVMEFFSCGFRFGYGSGSGSGSKGVGEPNLTIELVFVHVCC